MESNMKIAIIGAGFAGLATARHLRDFGHEVTVFEKAPDVGGVWSRTRAYPGLSTQNCKDTYCLSGHPMPKDYPNGLPARRCKPICNPTLIVLP